MTDRYWSRLTAPSNRSHVVPPRISSLPPPSRQTLRNDRHPSKSVPFRDRGTTSPQSRSHQGFSQEEYGTPRFIHSDLEEVTFRRCQLQGIGYRLWTSRDSTTLRVRLQLLLYRFLRADSEYLSSGPQFQYIDVLRSYSFRECRIRQSSCYRSSHFNRQVSLLFTFSFPLIQADTTCSDSQLGLHSRRSRHH